MKLNKVNLLSLTKKHLDLESKTEVMNIELGNLGTAAKKDVGLEADNIPVLDISGKLDLSVIPLSDKTLEFLDYPGLEHYDSKIKEWVDKKISSSTPTIDGVILGDYTDEDGKVHVSKEVVFNNICINGDVQMLDVAVGYSDRRLKTDIRNIESVLNKVLALSVCRYRPNEIALSAGVDDKEEIGLIADEVKNTFPEFIKESPINDILNSIENYITIDYSRMSAILVAVIQEMHQSQEERFSKLEEAIEKLNERLVK